MQVIALLRRQARDGKIPEVGDRGALAPALGQGAKRRKRKCYFLRNQCNLKAGTMIGR